MRFEIFATAAVLAAPVVMAQGPPKWHREDSGAVIVGAGGVVTEFDGGPPANPPPPPPADSPAPVPAPSPVADSPSPSPEAPAPTPAPADPPAAPAIDGGPGAMTWNIINKHGSPLSVIYGNNAGGPEPISATPGMMTSTTQIVFPTGWAGRVIIGPKDDVAGSKIEGSVMPQFNVDVSYVDGYTVPITCADHATGETIIGCNVDLFNNGQTCAEPGDGICYNTDTALHAFDGPPKPFFAPCAGAAYTFPNDNNADRVSTSPIVDCCVGAACPAPARQPGKRSLSNVARRWAYPRNVFE